MEPDAAEQAWTTWDRLRERADLYEQGDWAVDTVAVMRESAKRGEELEAGVEASPSEELVKAAQRLIDNEDRLANQVAIMSSEKARQAALLDIRAALAALRTTKEGEK